jgi:osmotically-inducible protein OsmY
VLSGLASSENEKAAAERIASDVYGVKEVVNEIEIVEHS